jgi:hypothetical protein
MKRLSVWSVVVIVLCGLAVPVLQADVKTREKSLLKFEGLLGGAFKMFGGSAAKDGITSTVALKGSRKSSMTDTSGEIIDLNEQKVYRVDLKKKEYTVVTFAQLRKEWEDAKAQAKKNADEMKKSQKEEPAKPEKEIEITADIKETGQKKDIAGYNAHEVILTITAKEKGKTLEEGGGSVLTSTMWLGPRIAALEETRQFDLKFIKAVYGDDLSAEAQQLAVAFAMFSTAQPMMQKMSAEGGKLQGTPLQTTAVFENVKSAEQMKSASSQQSSGGGGGLSGVLASRMMGGAPKQRSTAFTITHEYLSVDPAATEADVAMPAGFKEKK